MKLKVAYLGLDAHAHRCVLGYMNPQGEYLEDWRFATTEAELIRHVQKVPAQKKLLALEEGPLAYWIGQTLKPHVSEVLICDPRENKAISHNPHKDDHHDTRQLCRLNRLGELKKVYHPEQDHRAIFKAALQQYLDWRDQQVALKLKLKAKYRSWGVIPTGDSVYSSEGRAPWLEQIKAPEVRLQLQSLYTVLDTTVRAQRTALRRVVRLGRPYPEIPRLRQVPGVGIVGSHLFSAYLQCPERFATKQQLIRYARLGIRSRSSDDKPLGYQQLDRRGLGELKALTYRAWQCACRSKTNVVFQSYNQSLQTTHNAVHARLNTQRKILIALWGVWKNQSDFDPKTFLGTPQRPA